MRNVMIIILCIMIGLTNAQYFTNLVIDAENSKQLTELYPNEKGGYILVVKNSGEVDAYNISVTLQINQNILLSPSYVEFPIIERQKSVSIPVEVNLGDIDPSKTYSLLAKLTYTGYVYQGGFIQQSKKGEGNWILALNISSRRPSLEIEIPEISYVEPENEFILAIDLKNIGRGDATEVKIEIKNPEDLAVIGSPVDRVYEIKANEAYRSSFKLSVTENPSSKIYDIPVTITYLDKAEKKSFEEKFSTSINVKRRANLSISNIRISQEQLTIKKPTTVSLRIENAGEDDAENVEVKISSEGIEQQSFVGLLKKEEDSTAGFTIVPQKTGTQKIKVLIGYNDDFGWHQIEKEFNLEVYPNGEELYIVYLILAVGIIVAIVLLRKKKVNK